MKKNEERKRGYTTRPEWEPMKRLDKKNIEDILALTCKITEDKYGIIISNHHILYDGWSNGR